MAMVKANGYGHGASQVSKKAIDTGVDYLAVTTLKLFGEQPNRR